MAETMADKRKKQRASKATGLYEGVGKFKGKKSLNLKGKQLGKKGRAAAKKRTVSISDTKYSKKTGIVTGPAGKPLTGKVDMGGGNMAVYRNGKRVTAKPAAKATKTTSNKATAPKATAPKATAPKATPPKKTSNQTKPLTAAQKKAALSKGTSKSPTKGSGSSAGERKSIKGSGSSAGSNKPTVAKSTKPTSTGNGKKWNKPGGGGLVGPNSPFAKGGRSKLKEGSTRMMVEGAGMNTKRVKYVVRGGKLVRA